MGLYSPYQQKENNQNSIYLINPSVKEFQTTIFDDLNNSVTIILAPLETKEFTKSVGQTVLTHLATFILNEGGFGYKTDVNLELAAIKGRCIVHE